MRLRKIILLVIVLLILSGFFHSRFLVSLLDLTSWYVYPLLFLFVKVMGDLLIYFFWHMQFLIIQRDLFSNTVLFTLMGFIAALAENVARAEIGGSIWPPPVAVAAYIILLFFLGKERIRYPG